VWILGVGLWDCRIKGICTAALDGVLGVDNVCIGSSVARYDRKELCF